MNEKPEIKNRMSNTAIEESWDEQAWSLYHWIAGDLGHFAPQNWRWLSNISLNQIWRLWWYGNKMPGILKRPYSTLKKDDGLIKMRSEK